MRATSCSSGLTGDAVRVLVGPDRLAMFPWLNAEHTVFISEWAKARPTYSRNPFGCVGARRLVASNISA